MSTSTTISTLNQGHDQRTAVAIPTDAENTARINDLHQGIMERANKTIVDAIECGRLLSEVKIALKHGEWGAWCEENLSFSQRTATRYLRLFENQEQIGHDVQFESLTEVYGFLTDTRDPGDNTESSDTGGDSGQSDPSPPAEGVDDDPAGTTSSSPPPATSVERAPSQASRDNGGELVADPDQDVEDDAGFITLDQWDSLTPEERRAALNPQPDSKKEFNYQIKASIEWARYSWNPVSGCRHGCAFCYARDFANRRYPQGFVPSLYPSRLLAPGNTTPKKQKPEWSEVDILGHRNVFTCSMADLFGKWVPEEWIEAVLEQVEANPQWNFLFLSKFPIRMADFSFPENAWVGTTVENQGAVKRAEKAFKKIEASVKWLSCEPMLEQLQFNSLEMFDWVVMGGATASHEHEGDDRIDKSPATPAFRPPFEWIFDLQTQARAAGCKVYHKTNLLGERTLEYPNV